MASYNPSGTGTNAWTNPTYAYSDDTNYATAQPAKNSNVAGIWTNFGVSGSGTISKVELGVQAFEDTNNSYCSVSGQVTWNAGTNWSTDTEIVSATNLTTSSVGTIYWLNVTSATTWTWTNLGNSYLQARIYAKKGNTSTTYTVSLDTIWIRVTFTSSTTKTSDARLKKNYTTTKTSDARLKKTYTNTKTSDATLERAKTTYAINKYSDARLKKTIGITKTSDAKVMIFGSITKTSDATLEAGTTTNDVYKTSDARLLESLSTTKNSDATLNYAFSGGAGTVGSPYEISTLHDLDMVRYYLSSYFKVMNNIDASATSTWDGGNGWTPLGNNTVKFSGNFDGNGMTISGLYINRSGLTFVGLFGYVSGTVTKLEVSDVNITGGTYTGALAGSLFSGATITYCKTTGSVTGVTGVGGLIGSSSGSVSDSYSQASVSVSSFYGGGLIGDISNATVARCYSTGSVGGAGSNQGGLIGRSTSSTVTNSYWDTQTSGQSSSAGGTGKTTAEMKQIETFAPEWDISNL